MSYQNNATHVHCVSNLDGHTLERLYGSLLGRPEETFLERFEYNEQDPLDWMAVDCENPPGA